MKDPYVVLGVAREASADDIKKAYRKLARKLHPDLNPNDKKAEERFKEISAAYDLLSDSDKRARFDRGEIDASGAEKPRRSYRQHADAGQGDKYSEAFSFGGSIDDILEQMLRRRGSERAGPGGMGGEFRMRGQDANYVLKVGFVEAAAGTTKRIGLPTGKSLDVRIPPGTEDGQTLRLKGQGNAGIGGGEAGDAFVEIRVEPHPFFTRKGDDVHVEVPVTLGEAVLGGKITVPTIDGRVSLTVPPNSNSGTVLRLKGKGVPRAGHRGDQFVRLKVVLPERPDSDLAAFVRDWAEKHPYDVRGKAGMA